MSQQPISIFSAEFNDNVIAPAHRANKDVNAGKILLATCTAAKKLGINAVALQGMINNAVTPAGQKSLATCLPALTALKENAKALKTFKEDQGLIDQVNGVLHKVLERWFNTNLAGKRRLLEYGTAKKGSSKPLATFQKVEAEILEEVRPALSKPMNNSRSVLSTRKNDALLAELRSNAEVVRAFGRHSTQRMGVSDAALCAMFMVYMKNHSDFEVVTIKRTAEQKEATVRMPVLNYVAVKTSPTGLIAKSLLALVPEKSIEATKKKVTDLDHQVPQDRTACDSMELRRLFIRCFDRKITNEGLRNEEIEKVIVSGDDAVDTAVILCKAAAMNYLKEKMARLAKKTGGDQSTSRPSTPVAASAVQRQATPQNQSPVNQSLGNQATFFKKARDDGLDRSQFGMNSKGRDSPVGARSGSPLKRQ